jgi:hypothetical protein
MLNTTSATSLCLVDRSACSATSGKRLASITSLGLWVLTGIRDDGGDAASLAFYCSPSGMLDATYHGSYCRPYSLYGYGHRRDNQPEIHQVSRDHSLRSLTISASPSVVINLHSQSDHGRWQNMDVRQQAQFVQSWWTAQSALVVRSTSFTPSSTSGLV